MSSTYPALGYPPFLATPSLVASVSLTDDTTLFQSMLSAPSMPPSELINGLFDPIPYHASHPSPVLHSTSTENQPTATGRPPRRRSRSLTAKRSSPTGTYRVVDEAKREIRKLKNRESAAKSRLREQARVRQLEADVATLQQQNALLQGLLQTLATGGNAIPVPVPAGPVVAFAPNMEGEHVRHPSSWSPSSTSISNAPAAARV